MILSLREELDFRVNIVVTGMHLDQTFGEMYHEIEADGISITAKIPILFDLDGVVVMIQWLSVSPQCRRRGRMTNARLERYAQEYNENTLLIDSLGMIRYLLAMKYCTMVIGNFSSGIMEAMYRAKTKEFREAMEGQALPYGDGNTSERIVD